jgi:hypothetical protein
MTNPIYPLSTFSESDIKAHEPALKVGILGTVNNQGQPHLTLISSLQARTPTTIVWGQFIEGMSKEYIRRNPKTGFLIMTLDKNLWRGKADFTHTETTGPEFEMYNNLPLFRYNAYFGIHTVYYMNLVAQSGKHPLPMNRIIFSAVQTMAARLFAGSGGSGPEVMNPWTKAFMDALGNLKFLGYVGSDGYPQIIPVIQAQTAGCRRIIFSTSVYSDELDQIPQGAPVALFNMSLKMEDVLLRGAFKGIQRYGGVRCGMIEVDWVYNSMPPAPAQLYPPEKLESLTQF